MSHPHGPMFSPASPGSPTITPPISSKVVHLPWDARDAHFDLFPTARSTTFWLCLNLGIPTIHGSFHGNMMIVHHLIHWILGFLLLCKFENSIVPKWTPYFRCLSFKYRWYKTQYGLAYRNNLTEIMMVLTCFDRQILIMGDS